MPTIDRFSRPVRIVAGLALAAMLPLTAADAMGSRARPDDLVAAGFTARPANTPERQAMLAKLPDRKFEMRARGDTVHYVYADAKGCNCLYVGTEAAFGRYKRQQQRQHIADQNAFAAERYSDPAWNWGAWGPWSGPYGGFGPGFGW